jgi:hypothetical protein
MWNLFGCLVNLVSLRNACCFSYIIFLNNSEKKERENWPAQLCLGHELAHLRCGKMFLWP